MTREALALRKHNARLVTARTAIAALLRDPDVPADIVRATILTLRHELEQWEAALAEGAPKK